MFSKVVRPVRAYKTSISALFAFFQIDGEVAWQLVQCLEVVDPDFTQTVSVRDFANQYCKDSVSSMIAIYYQYALAFTSCSDESNNTMSMGHHHHYNEEEVVAQFHHIIDNCSYFDLLCFLFHFLTIADNRIVEMLYWMAFAGQKKAVSQSDLLALFDALYIDQLQAQLKPFQLARQRIEDACKVVDMDGLTAYRLQIFDIRVGGYYSKALLKVKNQLIQSILGKKTWKMLTELFHSIFLQLEDSYERFNTIPFSHTNHYNSNGINNKELQYRLIGILQGNRKQGRKEIRRLLRALLDYQHLATAEKEETKKNWKMTTFFASVLRGLPIRSNNTVVASTTATTPSATSANNTVTMITPSVLAGPLKTTGSVLASMVYEKLFGHHKNHHGYLIDDPLDGEEREEKDTIPLEMRYPEALEQSLEEVHDLAHRLQEEAERTMKKAEESLQFSVQLQSKAHESISKSNKTLGSRHGGSQSSIIGIGRHDSSIFPNSSSSRSGKSSRSMKKEKEGIPRESLLNQSSSHPPQMMTLDPLEEEHPESLEDEEDATAAAVAAAAAMFGDDNDHPIESDPIDQSVKDDSNHLEMREIGEEEEQDEEEEL